MIYREISIFSKQTGLFLGRTISGTGMSEALLDAHLKDGEGRIDGYHDHLSRRVDVEHLRDGERATEAHVIDYQPPQPSADHEWHEPTKRWRLSGAAQEKSAVSAAAQARIATLEAESVPLMRKTVLGDATARSRLQSLDDEIAELRLSI